MRAWTFAPLTRQSTEVSRRVSLLTLGGAALAAATAEPDRSAAKKKKSGADCKKKEKQRCTNDAGACRTAITAICQQEDGCIDVLRCCDECSANGFFTCFFDQLSEM